MKFRASPSSRGLGHHPFTVATGVRIPVGTPIKKQKALTSVGAFCFCPARVAASIAAKEIHRDVTQKTWRTLHTRVEFRLQHRGAIAQLGERLHGMQEVGGSIPPGSTTPDIRPSGCAEQFDEIHASPSSRGLGHHPFTVATGVRIPVGTPLIRRTPRPGMPGLFVHRLLRLRCGCPERLPQT